MKFFHVTGLYKITGKSGAHSETSDNNDINNTFNEYSKVADIGTLTAKEFIKEDNYERIILTGEVNHIQECFRKNLHSLYNLWKTNYPCNILYTGTDVIFLKECKFSDKFDKFMMFNHTEPKSAFGFDNYFNADVKYYPYLMDEKLWDIALNMEINWPEYNDNDYNWNYEQIIWNKMLWSQNLSISDCLKPEYAYQLMYYNIEQSNNFNNFDIKNAKIIHLAGTRHLFKLVNFIKENFNLEFKIN